MPLDQTRSTITGSGDVGPIQRGANYFGMSGPAEFIVAAVLFVLLIALNVLNILHRGFNSDEPQHLHVIWGWTRGFVQYRDNFDNHMPLFHILFAPIVGLIGERPTILYWMRFILLPAYFVAAWCTYQIGTRLFSRRAGVWAVIAAGFYSGYLHVAFEFRTDNLWTPLWLLCVAVMVGGAINARRALVAGLLLGFCFGVSMKSTLLLLSLLVSVPLAFGLAARKNVEKSAIYLVQCAGVFLGGTVLIPAAIMIFFAAKGVWPDFRYGVFDFNFLATRVYENGLLYKSHPALALIIFAIALLAAIYIAQWIVRTSGDPNLAFSRALVFLVAVSYLLALHFWPPISRTYTPLYPLAFVLLSGALLAFAEFARQKWKIGWVFRLLPLPAFIAFAECFLLLGTRTLWQDSTRQESSLLRSVLALTQPDDYVLDCKGETIFRRRCFRPILERITAKCIELGIIVDDAPERCVETQTCVVATLEHEKLSPRTRQFVERNYLPVTDNVRVAGVFLEFSAKNGFRSDFEVVIPAFYKVIAREGNVSGALDGTAYDGARFLAAGRHTFESTTPQNLALFWAQAVDRHFTPFDNHVSSTTNRGF